MFFKIRYITAKSILKHGIYAVTCNGSARNGIYSVYISFRRSTFNYIDGYKFTLFVEQFFSFKLLLKGIGIDFCSKTWCLTFVVESGSNYGVIVIFQCNVTPNRAPKPFTSYRQNYVFRAIVLFADKYRKISFVFGFGKFLF